MKPYTYETTVSDEDGIIHKVTVLYYQTHIKAATMDEPADGGVEVVDVVSDECEITDSMYQQAEDYLLDSIFG